MVETASSGQTIEPGKETEEKTSRFGLNKSIAKNGNDLQLFNEKNPYQKLYLELWVCACTSEGEGLPELIKVLEQMKVHYLG
jgi:hypothetical protein